MSVIKQLLRQYAEAMIESPDAVGEVLRKWAFVGEGVGASSNFDVHPDFEEVEEKTAIHFLRLFGRPFDSRNGGFDSWGDSDSYIIENMRWFRHPTGIEMGWYWDGDGLLSFYVPELEDEFYSGCISNSDCKKMHGWDFVERYEGD